MTTHALHPDQLKPGDMVGPWLITRVLGSGGSSRVFKVERDGRPYSMKLALRPLSSSFDALNEEEYLDEKTAWRRLSREAAALFTYASHPNLLRVYGVDFWPSPSTGYPFLVTDYVDGDTWHQWRWRKRPHAAGLVRTFSEVVRTVGVLHSHGVNHRDLKAENILIRRVDGRPFLIDFGTVRLPGTLTQTLGLPEGVLHLLPPEMLAYARSEGWKYGKPFQGGVTADLYALGVLLYQALTDLHPFDPKLPDEELVLAIATLPPVAPHVLNSLAPRSLSDIAMTLLEKRPANRFASTAELLLELDDALAQGRESPTWKVPLFSAEGDDAEEQLSDEATSPGESVPPKLSAAVEERSSGDEVTRWAPLPPVLPSLEVSPPIEGPPSSVEPEEQEASAVLLPPRRSWSRRLLLGSLGLSVLGLFWWLAPSSLTHPLEFERLAKGNPPMSLSVRSPRILAAWLCAAAGWGCPAAQVKPPEPADCPREAIDAMKQELKLETYSPLDALVDINQPGGYSDDGVYQDGPVIGRIVRGGGDGLPEGTLLHGRLWTGPTILEGVVKKTPAAMGRYTQAVLPDGRKYPVCIVLGDRDGRIEIFQGPQPGTYTLPKTVPMSVVWRWP